MKRQYALRPAAAPVLRAKKAIHRSDEKKQRLLEAAGELFAERGFKAARIQEISERANANIASINYHFRNKETLYQEVFWYAVAHSQFASGPYSRRQRDRPRELAAKEILRSSKSGCHSNAAWQPLTLLREMLDPTALFDSLMEQRLRPYQNLLESLVQDLLDPDADQHIVRFCALAVVALCGQFRSLEKFIKRLYPDDDFGAISAEGLAELVTRFVLAGIVALRAPQHSSES